MVYKHRKICMTKCRADFATARISAHTCANCKKIGTRGVHVGSHIKDQLAIN